VSIDEGAVLRVNLEPIGESAPHLGDRHPANGQVLVVKTALDPDLAP